MYIVHQISGYQSHVRSQNGCYTTTGKTRSKCRVGLSSFPTCILSISRQHNAHQDYEVHIGHHYGFHLAVTFSCNQHGVTYISHLTFFAIIHIRNCGLALGHIVIVADVVGQGAHVCWGLEQPWLATGKHYHARTGQENQDQLGCLQVPPDAVMLGERHNAIAFYQHDQMTQQPHVKIATVSCFIPRRIREGYVNRIRERFGKPVTLYRKARTENVFYTLENFKLQVFSSHMCMFIIFR